LKFALTISILAILHGQVFCQNDGPRDACESLRNSRNPCDLFICLTTERQYDEAYGYLVRNEIAECGGPEVQWARIGVLGANRQYEKARKLLDQLSESYPNEGKYYTENIRLDEMELMESFTLPAVVTPLATTNSAYNELFAWTEKSLPLVLTDRPQYDAYFPVRRQTEQGYDLIEGNNDVSGSEWHDRLKRLGFEQLGPGQVIGDSVLFFTAVMKGSYNRKSETRKLKIFELDLRNGKLKDLPEPVNTEGANNAYPCFAPSSGKLIFSSDREGGRGGMDIWETTFADGRWTEPKSFSYFINTPSDEMFPFAEADTLYYASNRADMGFGGMDIYGVDLKTGLHWNMGEPINSPYDDFQLVFASQEEAYMASNRPYGSGGDDIYHIRWAAPELFFEEITGIATWPLEAIGEKIFLIDDDQNILQSAVIERDGKFQFFNVKGYENYDIRVPDVEIPEGLSMDIINKKGRVIKTVTSDLKGSFHLELLNPIDYFIDELSNEDNSVLNIDIRGEVVPPRGGVRIVLLDSMGVSIGAGYTTEDGQFKFESVNPDNSYIIRSEVLNANDTIHILDTQGKILHSISPGTTKDYVFVRLGADDRVITITNENNQRVRISDKEVFELGRVYFEWDGFEINESGKRALLKLIKVLEVNPHVMVELSGHTDSRGSEAYNLKLSQWRIDSVIRFLEAGGIDRNRLSGFGYGEKHLRNLCHDGVECTEEQHAQNRRTEFKLIENSNPQPQ